jgi:UrcA family protein
MTISKFRFGFPLAIALATASAAAVAQQADQTPDANIEAGKVQESMVGLSYAGIPIEQFRVYHPVTYADLDLTTTSGAAELMRRVALAAKDACQQVDAADPIDLWNTNDISCVTKATDGGLKQANTAIAAAQTSSAVRTTQVSTN